MYSSRPSVWRMLVLCGCWLLVVTGHFLLCGWLAWKFSAPPDLPPFLKSLDPLIGRFGYGLSTGLELGWMLLWWVIVGLTFWGAVWMVRGADLAWIWWCRRLAPETHSVKSAVGSSAAIMWPVLTLSLLNLLMLPVGAANQPDSPTGLETAAALHWDDWNSFLLRSLPVMAGLGLMFATVVLTGSQIPAHVNGCLSIGLFIGSILVGLAVMGGWIWLTNDLFMWLPRYCGYPASIFLFYLSVSLLVCLPLLIASRRKFRNW